MLNILLICCYLPIKSARMQKGAASTGGPGGNNPAPLKTKPFYFGTNTDKGWAPLWLLWS